MKKKRIRKPAGPGKTEKILPLLDYGNNFSLHEGSISLYPFGQKELYSDEYLKWMNDPDITSTIGRFDYLMPVSRKKLIDYYSSLNPETEVFLAIYAADNLKRKGRFVGTLKIYDIEKLSQRASLGIAIGDKQSWNKGFASMAIAAASRYIFNVLGFRKITAGYLAKNIGMEKAFLKNGYEVEAVFKKQVFSAGDLVDHVFVCKFREKSM